MPNDRNSGSQKIAQQSGNEEPEGVSEAEAVLRKLASVFLNNGASASAAVEGFDSGVQGRIEADKAVPGHEDMYRVLVEQIPALVFIAYFDRGIGEAYVSPQIETTLGFSQAEWLEDPIRWYARIHPDDKQRWSVDAAQMLVTGNPLKAAYRVIAKDGKVVWFQCEAKIMRRRDGRPWFLHGVGFDISELKRTEEILQNRTSTLQTLSAQILRLRDEEYRKISRELHDSLGQYLVALKLNIDQLGRHENIAEGALSESKELINSCINETRTISHLLHPPLLDELGLVPAVEWYVEGFAKRSGIEVTLNLPPRIERLSNSIETTLFRVLQEALTNIHRHSGSHSAEVRLWIDGANVCLQITDHGGGIPEELLQKFQKTGGGAGVGLSGMRERVNDLGGRLEIRSGSQGTLVRVSIPEAIDSTKT